MGLFGFGKKEKDKMKDGLEKTRTGFWGNILNTLTGSKIDDDLYDELEEQLILADVGGDVAMKLVDALRDRVQEKGLKTGEQAADALRDIIADEMRPETEMALDGHPAVILVIGVNGVGKTTSIAKLADYYTRQGKKVMLAAGDTFRAAASEQLEIWAGRAGVPIVKAGEGADPAAVIFDTVKSATARGYDMVIADTAGRLHNKSNLMSELSNTAAAAKKVLKEQDHSQAAVCSAYAAQVYGLSVLAEDINDETNNVTRFIIVTNQKIFTPDASKISICFELPHQSGSLYQILSHFIYNDLNMTKIESRPVEGKSWEYRFFVDFEGNLEQPGVKNAIRGLREEARNLKILGNY